MFRGFNLALETEFKGYKPKGKSEIRTNSADIKADIEGLKNARTATY